MPSGNTNHVNDPPTTPVHPPPRQPRTAPSSGARKARANYLSAPHVFNLNLACMAVCHAFDVGVYLVGSCLHRPDYRDVDVRAIVSDATWARLFGPVEHGSHSALWSVLCVGVAAWLRERTGLPIDFQVQQQTAANQKYGDHPRHALGIALPYAGGGEV